MLLKSLNRRTLLQGGASMLALSALPQAARGQLRIEITGLGANLIPVGLAPMNGSAETGISIMQIVEADLGRTGLFRLVTSPEEATLEETLRPKFADWQEKDASVLATGTIVQLADGNWDIQYRLFDTVRGVRIDEARYSVKSPQLRMTAHRIADRIWQKLTDTGPLFASRIAYVVQHSPVSYELIVADSDGANARAVLRSREPVISPAWSPDGRQLAYVSFEAKKPVVYVHTLATGERRLVAGFRGNNSAPAFSPDGKTLAVALSRDGYTQLFLMDVAGGNVRRFSRSLAIDTEPVFSSDGRWVYYTSDRGGSAQIYRQPVAGGPAERVTFASNYAVSPALSPDGTQLAYITRMKDRYRVAIMDIATGQEMVLTRTERDESPCFAPNGRMIVYASERNGLGVLATVSVDGSVHAWLSGPQGDIREPTWGPVLR